MGETLLKTYSFQRCHRISSKKDIARFFKKYRTFRGNYLYIKIVQNNLPVGRLLLAITKKAGNAVKRNKIKRCIRESFRHHKERARGLDLKVSLNNRVKSDDISSQSIEQDFISFTNSLNKPR